ncbi:hypothetical protein [Qipengyuania gaetbuli]|nr:hypothetical protein [Qipengyuania gaetbuli]
MRSKNVFIIAGLARNNGGAVVIDDAGKIVSMASSKRDALAALGCE